jgi:beta-N-acetylhexosaminidase
MPLRLALTVLATAGLLSVAPAPAAAPASAAAAPSLQHLIGQKLVVSMDGHTPSSSLLDRARRGRIGGVIIHGFNFSSAAQLRSIAKKLQQAAADGGQQPLLIAVDQEGGSVKTVSWIPPRLSPPEMGDLGSRDTARAQGRKTGTALLGLGINTDLAPVADVPASTSSFMFLQGRTWSFSARKTSRLANAFALGLADRSTLATMKHFPGLGLATKNTDDFVVHIDATRSQLAPGLRPYRHAAENGVPLVMLSNAVYKAYDRSHAAGWSHAVGTTLLRGELGYGGVTITDSLDGAANSRGIPTNPLALKAAKGGTDMLLLTGSEASSRSVFRSLLDAAKAGQIRHDRLTASYGRILALEAGL